MPLEEKNPSSPNGGAATNDANGDADGDIFGDAAGSNADAGDASMFRMASALVGKRNADGGN